MSRPHSEIRPALANLARRIKERRSILGLSQERLAELAGLSVNFLAQIEIGEKTPSMRTLVRLARALEVPVHKLLEEDTGGKWLDEGKSILVGLEGLKETDAMFALGLFRSTVEHLKGKHRSR